MTSAHKQSLEDPEAFWLPRAKRLLAWTKEPTRAVEVDGRGGWRWFPDGELNACYNALDRHPADAPAIFYDSPVTGTKERISYGTLLERVACVAGVLRGLGVVKGDTVLLYMPMIPEAVAGMLACARIGAVLTVVFGGFAPPELLKRIEDAKPNVIISVSCGVEAKRVIPYKPLIEQAVRAARHKPQHLVIVRRAQVHVDLDGSTGMEEHGFHEACGGIRRAGKQVRECTPTNSNDPFYLLYTSGTTGKPKGVLRECGGHAVAMAFTMEYLFGLKPGDTIFSASDIGWVVGHSYIVYAPLLAGIATVLYEGKPVGTPDAGAFWRVCAEYNASVLFCAPTALRAIRSEDPNGELLKKYNLRRLRAVFLAGERSEPGIVRFYQELMDKLAAPGALMIDNYWSTESGSPKTGVPLNATEKLTPRPGTAGPPMPGMDLRIVDDDGNELPPGQPGNIVMKAPLAPSAFTTLWRNPAGFYDSYFRRFGGRYYDSGDSGFIGADDGYVNVMARSDDVINIAAHRLSTGSIEEILAAHAGVAEACVVGMPDPYKGQMPLAFVIRSSASHESHADLFRHLNAEIRAQIGGIASLGGVVELKSGAMPKTRSGKTLRRVLRELAEQASRHEYEKEVKVPATIEDAGAVQAARETINEFFKKNNPKPKL